MLEYNNFDRFDEEFSSEKAGPAGTQQKRKRNNETKVKKKESLKVRLFKIYYSITKDRNTDKGFAFFLILVLFIQIYDLMLSKVMKLPFKGLLYDEISDIFDIIRIYPAVIR